jgi:heat shock protein HslJ
MRTLALPIAAAAAVAAISVGVVVAVNRDGSHHPVTVSQSPSQQPSTHLPAEQTPFYDTEWRLESVQEGNQSYVVPQRVIASIRFNRNGTASGTDGCTAFRGRFTLSIPRSGGHFDHRMTAQTLILCTGPRGDVSGVFDAAMRSVGHWLIADEKLRLTSLDGGTVMTFRANSR